MLAAVGRDRSLSTTKPLLDSPSQPRRSLSASSPLGRYSASAHDDDAPAEPPPPASFFSSLCTLARRALVVLCVLAAGRGVWAARAHLTTAIELLARQIRGAGAWGAVGASGALALWVVCLLPTFVFEVFAGHLFPLRTAVAVCVVGKTVGASLCFAIARSLSHTVEPERLLARHRRLQALARVVHEHPLKTTLLVRFAWLPAPVKNYGWTVVGIEYRIFLLATLAEGPVYALPAAVVGSQVDDLADVVSGKTQPGWAGKLMVATGLGCLLLLLFGVGALSERLINAADQQDGGLPVPLGGRLEHATMGGGDADEEMGEEVGERSASASARRRDGFEMQATPSRGPGSPG